MNTSEKMATQHDDKTNVRWLRRDHSCGFISFRFGRYAMEEVAKVGICCTSALPDVEIRKV